MQDLKQILAEVSFPGYDFAFSKGRRTYLQATFTAVCAKTGHRLLQHTRKWYVSQEATKSEVVQTMFKCVLTSVEHEARENFKYKGRAVFGPHINVEALFAASANLEERYDE